MISSSLWGNISDKYGRKTVSLQLCLHFTPLTHTTEMRRWSHNNLHKIRMYQTIHECKLIHACMCTHRVSRWVCSGLCSMGWWAHLHLFTDGSLSYVHWWALVLEGLHSREYCSFPNCTQYLPAWLEKSNDIIAARLIEAFNKFNTDGGKTEELKLNSQVTQSHWFLQGIIYQAINGSPVHSL